MTAPERILIVKLGAVGDVVHTLYALRALRETFPGARIGWVVEDKSVEAVRGNADVDELFVFRRREKGGGFKALGEYLRIARRLRAFAPDVAIDFQALFKSGVLTRLSGAKERIGFDKWREGNFLFTNRRTASEPHQKHAVEKNFALLRLLNVAPSADAAAPLIALSDDDHAAADAFFAKSVQDKRPVVAVNPGASWPTKRWPPERYGEVAKALGNEGALPVAIWGPGEEEMANTVVRVSGGTALLAPPTTIKELAHFLSRCDLYVGGDTGPMHIAAIVGTPVAALFAPSDPDRVHPWNVPYRVIEPEGVECLHCWKRDYCERKCIEYIPVEPVVTAARALLRETAA